MTAPDFLTWAEEYAVIRDKLTGADIPFRPNSAQLKLLEVMERQRRARKPIRVILLKARQWGGSTLVQLYMAWIQLTQRRNWNSAVCAHNRGTAATLLAMYDKMLSRPDTDKKMHFKRLTGAHSTFVIPARECRVTIATSESPESLRGHDIQMAHLREVAFWRATDRREPSDLVRAVVSGIPPVELSVVVMESTANGVGTFFHNEWLRAERGESDKEAVFVAWHEIEIYRTPVDDPDAVFARMDPYERDIQQRFNLSPSQIAWYQNKRREYPDHRSMMAEYPSTPEEAFSCDNRGVFPAEHLDRLRALCSEPAFRGEIRGEGRTDLDGDVDLVPAENGRLWVWRKPQRAAQYVVTVDVGGRSENSDRSVVCVVREGERPEVVAQWAGHGDHDLLAWRAARIARWYNDALLVVESNTIESGAYGGGATVLDTLGAEYPNLFFRGPGKPGYHTNMATKPKIIARLITAVREGTYIERCAPAVDEMASYEQLPNGAYAARPGRHDDMLITRALALDVLAKGVPSVGHGGPIPMPGFW